MKRVLGLDLGSTSIGWAIIEENSIEVLEATHQGESDKIVAIGSRIIPLTTDESTQFSKGQALTKNADRTFKRTQRKGFDRYQLRRTILLEELKRSGIYDGTPIPLNKLELWGLRAKAVNEQISLAELGRVLCHINQKRGYRTAKSDFGDKKLGAHVQQVVDRYREIKDRNITVGQFMYESLKTDDAFRCKDRTYPRLAYVEEYDAIMEYQKAFYPDVLTTERIAHIRDYIIFHQRPLKSCKHLVGRCELERHDVMDKSGRMRNQGPKVTPRTSPLFQACKIWESINNLNINNKVNDTLHITLEQKQKIYEYMRVNEKLTSKDLAKFLGVKPTEWFCSKAVGKGLQGDTTYFTIKKALGSYPNATDLLRFDIKFSDGNKVNADTGEITKIVDASFEREPLYQLWHALYSISDIDELRRVLRFNFGIEDETVVEALCQIDFVKAGYGNKSSRAIRKILPYLQEGMQYYDAKIAAGYDDTTLTKEQNEARELLKHLPHIQKGELRQPVVEKILNQLVNLVNALMDEYGRFDEIRVELARELKQSREERESATREISRNQKVNETIAKRIQEEYGLAPTRSRIQKYKMWEESEHICMYCGNPVNVNEFLLGFGVEVEHIIPRSVLFDDSFSNKVCACRACNKEKNNRTAYDFMKSKGEDSGEFKAYVARVNDLADRYNTKLPIPVGISKSKRNKLLMSAKDIPSDFIERQLRESQYIAKKAKEMLLSICHNVYATSGSITDFVRHIWGWDEVLHSLNFERYRSAGLTEMVERDVNGKKVEVERIKDWSKRMDHRHHAVDALTIACTKQGYIQRINNLSSLKEASFKPLNHEDQSPETKQRLTRLERYIQQQPHFSTAEVERAVEGIAVSFKSGKRAASVGKRYIRKEGKRICVQRGIIIPRGALSEESIYGRIRNSETGKLDYVIKYPVSAFTQTKNAKSPDIIIDKAIRDIVRVRLLEIKNDNKNIATEPLLDHQGRMIRTIRCRAKLDKGAIPIRFNDKNEAISFVNTGSNHNVAIYVDNNGEWNENISTFWHAVERKKYGIDTIIMDPAYVWDNNIMESMPESFLLKLPEANIGRFKFSMQLDEMFILGMNEELYQEAMRNNDYALLSKYLYRVQTISDNDYRFRHHIETTTTDESSTAKIMGKMKRLSRSALAAQNPHKVHVSVTGKITEI